MNTRLRRASDSRWRYVEAPYLTLPRTGSLPRGRRPRRAGPVQSLTRTDDAAELAELAEDVQLAPLLDELPASDTVDDDGAHTP
jgi:hypothetical protein